MTRNFEILFQCHSFRYICERPSSSFASLLIACSTIDMYMSIAKLINGSYLLINLISY
jgi:hypothetical protein